jgi:hypothetical protein
VAVGLAAVEVAVAGGLLLPGPAAPIAGALLLGLYAGAISANLARGRAHIDCGCGGPGGSRPLHRALVLRNLGLALLLLVSALPPGSRSLVPLDAATLVGATLCLVVLYAGLDVALANAARRSLTLGPGGATWSTR